MQEFVNPPTPVDELPSLEESAFVPIDPNFLRVSLLGIGLTAALTVVGGIVAAVVVPRNGWIAIAAMVGVLVLLAAMAWLRILEVRHIAYQVRMHDLSYRSGVLIKRVSTVPFVRVQHARIRQGPVQRRFGLASLDVNSAGPDLRIDGLNIETAERLKSLVVERAGDLTEDS